MFKEFVAQHWPEGLLATMTGLLTFFSRRELKRNDERHEEAKALHDAHELRLRELEVVTVTRDDFDELRSSMMASMVNLSSTINANMNRMHDENVGTLNRIHARVDDLWKRE